MKLVYEEGAFVASLATVAVGAFFTATKPDTASGPRATVGPSLMTLGAFSAVMSGIALMSDRRLHR